MSDEIFTKIVNEELAKHGPEPSMTVIADNLEREVSCASRYSAERSTACIRQPLTSDTLRIVLAEKILRRSGRELQFITTLSLLFPFHNQKMPPLRLEKPRCHLTRNQQYRFLWPQRLNRKDLPVFPLRNRPPPQPLGARRNDSARTSGWPRKLRLHHRLPLRPDPGLRRPISLPSSSRISLTPIITWSKKEWKSFVLHVGWTEWYAVAVGAG